MAVVGVIEANGSNFQDLIASGSELKIVKFHAVWCAPCRAMNDMVAKAAAEHAGVVSFYSVDIDHSEELARQYSVQAVPTMVAIRNGKLLETKVGGMTESALRAWIDKLLQQ